MEDKVTIFKPYEFQPGQKIHISGGKRKGDWEILDYDGKKLTLRCPVSNIKINCTQFCYFVDETVQEWPQKNMDKEDG